MIFQVDLSFDRNETLNSCGQPRGWAQCVYIQASTSALRSTLSIAPIETRES